MVSMPDSPRRRSRNGPGGCRVHHPMPCACRRRTDRVGLGHGHAAPLNDDVIMSMHAVRNSAACPLTSRWHVLGSGARRVRDTSLRETQWKCSTTTAASTAMRAASFRSSICNAGPLNIFSSPVTDACREGFEKLAGDRSIRVVMLRRPEREEHDRRRRHQGDGEARPEVRRSLHHATARPLRGRAAVSGARHRAACPAGASAAASKSPPPAISGLRPMTPNSACRRCVSASPR